MNRLAQMFSPRSHAIATVAQPPELRAGHACPPGGASVAVCFGGLAEYEPTNAVGTRAREGEHAMRVQSSHVRGTRVYFRRSLALHASRGQRQSCHVREGAAETRWPIVGRAA